ncbi:hypothetical protein E3U43_021063 [Larimichthys crocea]|uniref:Uncharacterized protein n=1 Tax=Larimichthys crocea TaxID=215358 RepID=A0ACD3Q966_LARCR|nr:hypothetical protein E3U43_021063 [Larimichthys crocea]
MDETMWLRGCSRTGQSSHPLEDLYIQKKTNRIIKDPNHPASKISSSIIFYSCFIRYNTLQQHKGKISQPQVSESFINPDTEIRGRSKANITVGPGRISLCGPAEAPGLTPGSQLSQAVCNRVYSIKQ